MWLVAPDTVYEGSTFLVEIVLADGQGRPLAGTQSVRLRPSEERMQVENGRGSTRVLGASAGERNPYIAGRCMPEDGTYLTGVSNTTRRYRRAHRKAHQRADSQKNDVF